MENELKILIKALNGFDFYYMYTDDHTVWQKWAGIEKTLKEKVEAHKEELIKSGDLSQMAMDHFNLN